MASKISVRQEGEPARVLSDDSVESWDMKKHASSAFKQQRLPAWSPILSPSSVLPIFLVVGALLIPAGVGLLFLSESVREYRIDYTYCPQYFKENGTFGQRTCAEVIADTYETCYCAYNFSLELKVKKPVFLYYQLGNYYQNHRRYVNSRDDYQLLGHLDEHVDTACAPFDYDDKGRPIAPCGAVADSLFNDTLRLQLRWLRNFEDKPGCQQHSQRQQGSQQQQQGSQQQQQGGQQQQQGGQQQHQGGQQQQQQKQQQGSQQQQQGGQQQQQGGQQQQQQKQQQQGSQQQQQGSQQQQQGGQQQQQQQQWGNWSKDILGRKPQAAECLPMEVPVLRTGIAWPTDKKFRFANPPGNLTEALAGFAKPRNWRRHVYELDPEDEDNNGFMNEDLIVWMRTAGLPSFRKLYRRVQHNKEPFKTGLPAGNYTLYIDYNYAVAAFHGDKTFIVTSTTAIGVGNRFLGAAYVSVGAVCLLLGALFVAVHLRYRQATAFMVSVEHNTPYL